MAFPTRRLNVKDKSNTSSFTTCLSSCQRTRFVFSYLFVHRLICVMQGIDPKKPFHHPAIVNTIRESFFKRKRGPSIAQKHQSLFSSSLDTGMAAEEVELPPAMVAMAAVAASLSLPH